MIPLIKKYGKYCYLIISAAVVSSCTQPLTLKNMAYDAPGYYMFGRIPQRSFYSDLSVGEVIEKWNNQTSGSQSNSSIVIYNNTVFVSDLSGRIYGFDRLTGILSGFEKNSGSIEVTPVVNNLRILFVLNEQLENYSTFKVFDFINGKTLIEERIEGGVPNELIRLGDGVIVLTDKGELIKFNFAGFREWSTKTYTTSLSSPAAVQLGSNRGEPASTQPGINREVIVFGNQAGEIIIASAQSGEIKSRTKFKNAITGGISIENGNAYFADETGKVYSFNIIKKEVNWVKETGSKILSTPVMNFSKIFIGNLSGRIFALDKNNGKEIWQINTHGIINTTPLITKNVLIQPNVNKKVYFINSSNGTIEKTLEFDRRTKLNPVIYDSLLYIGSDRGLIHAYKVYGTD